MHLTLLLALMTSLLDNCFLRRTFLSQEPNNYHLDSLGNKLSLETYSRLENKGWKLLCTAEFSICRQWIKNDSPDNHYWTATSRWDKYLHSQSSSLLFVTTTVDRQHVFNQISQWCEESVTQLEKIWCGSTGFVMPNGRSFVYTHDVMEHTDPEEGWGNAPQIQNSHLLMMSMSNSRQWK